MIKFVNLCFYLCCGFNWASVLYVKIYWFELHADSSNCLWYFFRLHRTGALHLCLTWCYATRMWWLNYKVLLSPSSVSAPYFCLYAIWRLDTGRLIHFLLPISLLKTKQDTTRNRPFVDAKKRRHRSKKSLAYPIPTQCSRPHLSSA